MTIQRTPAGIKKQKVGILFNQINILATLLRYQPSGAEDDRWCLHNHTLTTKQCKLLQTTNTGLSDSKTLSQDQNLNRDNTNTI